MATASSLSPMERLHLREQLQDLWREQVDILSNEDHRAGSTTDGGDLARQRAAARTLLLEAEAAMRRMDCRRYGICEQCGKSISTADLFTAPQRRRCSECDRPPTVVAD